MEKEIPDQMWLCLGGKIQVAEAKFCSLLLLIYILLNLHRCKTSERKALVIRGRKWHFPLN